MKDRFYFNDNRDLNNPKIIELLVPQGSVPVEDIMYPDKIIFIFSVPTRGLVPYCLRLDTYEFLETNYH